MRMTTVPECKTAVEYLKASILAIDLLEGVRRENATDGGSTSSWNFERDCQCPQPCYREMFEMQSDTGYYDFDNRSLLRVNGWTQLGTWTMDTKMTGLPAIYRGDLGVGGLMILSISGGVCPFTVNS
jgi:hypothetical protein